MTTEGLARLELLLTLGTTKFLLLHLLILSGYIIYSLLFLAVALPLARRHHFWIDLILESHINLCCLHLLIFNSSCDRPLISLHQLFCIGRPPRFTLANLFILCLFFHFVFPHIFWLFIKIGWVIFIITFIVIIEKLFFKHKFIFFNILLQLCVIRLRLKWFIINFNLAEGWKDEIFLLLPLFLILEHTALIGHFKKVLFVDVALAASWSKFAHWIRILDQHSALFVTIRDAILTSVTGADDITFHWLNVFVKVCHFDVLTKSSTMGLVLNLRSYR